MSSAPGPSRVSVEEAPDLSAARQDAETILAVDEALARLGEACPRQRRVVELRYFVGLTVPETAEAMELGRATVERDWAVARRWLAREMGRSAAGTRGRDDSRRSNSLVYKSV